MRLIIPVLGHSGFIAPFVNYARTVEMERRKNCEMRGREKASEKKFNHPEKLKHGSIFH